MMIGLLVGAFIGLSLRGIPGAVMGAVVGYFVAKPLMGMVAQSQAWRVRSRFAERTFAVMGAVCKADGAVTADEIRVVEQLFQRLRLDADGREAARQAFNRGKTSGFDLDGEVAAFAELCRGQKALLNLFLQLQLAAVAADGQVHPEEHRMLVRIARGLGLSEAEVNRLEAMLRGERGNDGGGKARLEDAYAVLGVSPRDSDADIRRAYRRLMNENHPDKLAAKGLPESMRSVAEEKTRTITAAYDRIKAARG